MHVNAFRKSLKILPLALLAMAAACNPTAEDQDGGEPLEITDVDPREAVPAEEPPEVGTDPSQVPPIDPRDAAEQDLAPLERDLYAHAEIEPVGDRSVSGRLDFHYDGEMLRITGTLTGLHSGQHGLHVHVVGDCSAPDAASALGHFAPDDDPHGSPRLPPSQHHVGDLGNIVADRNGVAEVDKTDSEMTLGTGTYTIVGRAVIVHAEPDDLTSQPSGDAAGRIGCGVVERDVEPAYRGSR